MTNISIVSFYVDGGDRIVDLLIGPPPPLQPKSSLYPIYAFSVILE